VTAVAKATVPFQITQMPAGKPGVILWQIENEYNYAQFPGEVKLHQLQALAHDSRDLGIDVPLITCMTMPDHVLSRRSEAFAVSCASSKPSKLPISAPWDQRRRPKTTSSRRGAPSPSSLD